MKAIKTLLIKRLRKDFWFPFTYDFFVILLELLPNIIEQSERKVVKRVIERSRRSAFVGMNSSRTGLYQQQNKNVSFIASNGASSKPGVGGNSPAAPPLYFITTEQPPPYLNGSCD